MPGKFRLGLNGVGLSARSVARSTEKAGWFVLEHSPRRIPIFERRSSAIQSRLFVNAGGEEKLVSRNHLAAAFSRRPRGEAPAPPHALPRSVRFLDFALDSFASPRARVATRSRPRRDSHAPFARPRSERVPTRVMAEPKRFAMVCAANMNRSMEAHKVLLEAGMDVSSYGAGRSVKLPGASRDDPHVFEFGRSPTRPSTTNSWRRTSSSTRRMA